MSIITICRQTASHFKNLLSSSNKSYILIGVKGGGCNGLKYYIEPSSDVKDKLDESMSLHDVPIVICGKSVMHLIGSHVHWETDNMGSGIRIDNPNATSSCGCGDTFSVPERTKERSRARLLGVSEELKV